MDNAIGDIKISEVLKHKYTFLYIFQKIIIRSSLSSSDTYRGISLFNGIYKLFDYVIMHTCNDYLYTSDLQFGFKPQHSTTMCSLVYNEITIICQLIKMCISVYYMLVRLLIKYPMEINNYIIESISSVLYYTIIIG